jgi:hypothetical protein
MALATAALSCPNSTNCTFASRHGFAVAGNGALVSVGTLPWSWE